jgi:hypothetical protein
VLLTSRLEIELLAILKEKCAKNVSYAKKGTIIYAPNVYFSMEIHISEDIPLISK